MPMFHLRFHGRSKGTDEKRDLHIKELDAPTEEQAWWRLWETHEAISRLSIKRVGGDRG